MSKRSQPLLKMQQIHKSFPGVRALRGVDLELAVGEVLGLIGENGAGKSTLIKMLGGAQQPDSGTIEVAGRSVRLQQPSDAIEAGIGVIYQEFNLIPGLTAWENIFLGREQSRGFVRRSSERQRALELFEQIGVKIPIDLPCASLSVAQMQVVEIAKALSQDVRLIVMDEPSAALTPAEVERLLAMVRDLSARDIGVIYISHRLNEIEAIADRVSVLRDGRNVGDAAIGELTRQEMIQQMVGRPIRDEYPKVAAKLGPTRLKVEGLARGDNVRDVSFSVRQGEVLGLTGLVGSGRTELVRLIFGADRHDEGTIWLDDRKITIRGPRDAIAAGICLLSEDRRHEGLVIGLSVRENFALPNFGDFSRWGFVRRREEARVLSTFVDRLKIKISDPEQMVGNLSGGNQQKVVLAKWLQRNAKVVIFDEPTRGIDVGAKYEIHQLINELAAAGKAIVMISSELPEILGMSDRILVMHEGHLSGEVSDVATATQEQLMKLAIGANR
ncbi:MAG: sugar ABC transporter ATP-binding protein [Pirellulaceae bacterium]